MKVIILAGGFGTRISEESHLRPKPMIEIGDMPILWHIMKIYSSYGFDEFIICAGYKQHMIKEYFADYYLHRSDVTFDFTDGRNEMTIHRTSSDRWKVTVVDTGLHTMTGGRVKRVQHYVGDEPFLLTYGDGVSDIDVPATIAFHNDHDAVVTMTGVNFAQTKGVLSVAPDGRVESFREKADSDSSVINGGFMVCAPKVFDYIEGDGTVFEQKPLNALAAEGKLFTYHHHGFWKCMDTQRDRYQLEDLWAEGNAPWKIW